MSRQKDYTLLSRLGFQDSDRHNDKHDAALVFISQPHVLKRIIDFDKLIHSSKYQTMEVKDKGDSNCLFRRTICSLEDTSPSCIHYQMDLPITKGQDHYKQTIGFMDGCIRFKLNFSTTVYWCEFTTRVKKAEYSKVNTQTKQNALRQFNQVRGDDDVEDMSIEFVTHMDGSSISKPLDHQEDNEKNNDSGSDSDDNDNDDTSSKSPSRPNRGHGRVRLDAKQEYLFHTGIVQKKETIERLDFCFLVETKIGKVSLSTINNQLGLYNEYLPVSQMNWIPDKVHWLLLHAFDLPNLHFEELIRKNILPVRLGTEFDEWCRQQFEPKEEEEETDKKDLNTHSKKRPRLVI